MKDTFLNHQQSTFLVTDGEWLWLGRVSTIVHSLGHWQPSASVSNFAPLGVASLSSVVVVDLEAIWYSVIPILYLCLSPLPSADTSLGLRRIFGGVTLISEQSEPLVMMPISDDDHSSNEILNIGNLQNVDSLDILWLFMVINVTGYKFGCILVEGPHLFLYHI